MPASRKRAVDCVSAGEPPPKMLKDVETVKFVIYNFKDRKEKGDEVICSPPAKAHGYDWSIDIGPRCHAESPTDSEHIFVSLKIVGRKEATATCSFRYKGYEVPISKKITFNQDNGCGCKIFLSRDDVVENYLEEDGSFVIECDIRIAAKSKRVWYPKELQQQETLLDLYQDASSETADVAFSVGETIFRVHKSILSCRGKKLYEIAKESKNDGVPIPIHSVSGEIFKEILNFVYTVKTPTIENADTATEFLVAADRYEFVHLKLYVESVIVDKFLTAGNAAELLVVADSYSCALLKEAATNLFVADTETVKNADAWSKIRESTKLLEELLDSLVCSKKQFVGVNNGTSDEVDQLDVTTLREELDKANLQLDGSRKVLIDRLNTHRQR